MKLSSPAFGPEGFIPSQYTCEGENINPALDIMEVPEGTACLVLIVDDPDAPGRVWVHWVVFNIPVTDRIEQNSVPGIQGTNDFKRQAYGGPCPPSGTHRYYFKLYALDRKLDLESGVSKAEVNRAMAAHVIDEAVLVGRYRKIGDETQA